MAPITPSMFFMRLKECMRLYSSAMLPDGTFVYIM